jgi:atypical dual specificity phosphatase
LNREVIIEEKIDGANMGISIDPNTFQVIFQNRSHYVSAGYATQFKKLNIWENKHREDLFKILVPGRHILFGEWLFAKHSIHYDNLPGYFVAFDIFDKNVGKFLSRNKLEELLSQTQITIIRKITQNTFKKIDDIVAIVKYNSDYYNGPIEGIYVRVCEDDYTVDRAKIVRHDFLSGNQDITEKFQHWASKDLVENSIKINDFL